MSGGGPGSGPNKITVFVKNKTKTEGAERSSWVHTSASRYLFYCLHGSDWWIIDIWWDRIRIPKQPQRQWWCRRVFGIGTRGSTWRLITNFDQNQHLRTPLGCLCPPPEQPEQPEWMGCSCFAPATTLSGCNSHITYQNYFHFKQLRNILSTNPHKSNAINL